MGVVEQRRPLRIGQEIEQRNAAEEDDRLPDEHRDDRCGREYGDQSRQQQHCLDRALGQPAANPLRRRRLPRAGGHRRQRAACVLQGKDAAHRSRSCWRQAVVAGAIRRPRRACRIVAGGLCLRVAPRASSVPRSSGRFRSAQRRRCRASSGRCDQGCRCRLSQGAGCT
ncbi:MAG: hypothetical protein AW07_03021 [Candidatus Accumulibacter sp. SK-11]|nr:MAG: hypothetical protein AW07_03021 [Candidatus Accumulibacter sp. SK-11]